MNSVQSIKNFGSPDNTKKIYHWLLYELTILKIYSERINDPQLLQLKNGWQNIVNKIETGQIDGHELLNLYSDLLPTCMAMLKKHGDTAGMVKISEIPREYIQYLGSDTLVIGYVHITVLYETTDDSKQFIIDAINNKTQFDKRNSGNSIDTKFRDSSDTSDDDDDDDDRSNNWKSATSDETTSDNLQITDDDNEAIIISKLRRKIKNKDKITSDEKISIYNVSKKLKSNKLAIILKKLNEHRQLKSVHMKQELLEHLIRHCIREVVSQMDDANNSQKQIPISYGDVIFNCLLNVPPSNYSPEDWDILSVSVNGQDVTNNPSIKQVVDGFMSNEGGFGKTSQDREHNNQIWQSQFINSIDTEIKGAAAPPADGQGTADQPAIPKNTQFDGIDEGLVKIIRKTVNEILDNR